MRKILAAAALAAGLAGAVQAADYQYQLYFGLSKPAGGVVTPAEWAAYEADFAKAFAGFNVADTVGYYMEEKEGSRIITLFADDCRESRIEAMAQAYAKRFGQDSVLMAKTPLVKWASVGQTVTVPLDDSCDAN